jgi:MraZ protein
MRGLSARNPFAGILFDAHIIPCYPKLSRSAYSVHQGSGQASALPQETCASMHLGGGQVGTLDRFVSHYTNRLDAKGRVSIPAAFRGVLARDGFEGLYVHPSLDADALDCGGHALMRQIEGLLTSLSPYSEEHDAFSTALIGTSEILKIDPEGRIILTETLKSCAGISSEVTFVGQGSKFQIWEPERFKAYLDEAKSRVRAFRKQLSARHAAESAPPGSQGARE